MTHGAVGRDTRLSVELHLVGLHNDAVLLIVTDKFSKFIKYIIEQVAGSLLLVFFISAAGAMGRKVWQVDLCASLRD